MENKIIYGNCNDVMKLLQNDSIDLIITSPPYYNAREYSHWQRYEDYLEFLKEVFGLAHEKLKPGRMCCVNISVIIEPRTKRSSESNRIALPFHFVNLMEKIGYKFLEDIIWIKPEGSSKNRNGGFFQHRKPIAYKPNIINEYIFVFQKKSDFLIDKILKNIETSILNSSLVRDGYERTNVWKFNPESKSKHSAPYPEILSDKLIEYYSVKNDIVLDMFIGSGTTAISALKSGRKYIGIEYIKKHCEMAEERIKKFKILESWKLKI